MLCCVLSHHEFHCCHKTFSPMLLLLLMEFHHQTSCLLLSCLLTSLIPFLCHCQCGFFLSCVSRVDQSLISVTIAGGKGCKLVVAGTYKPDVQLLLLQGGDIHKGVSHQPCFLPLSSVSISPLLRSAFQECFACPEEPPPSPRKELPDQAIPESVQILPVDSPPHDIQVCCSDLLQHAMD